MERISYTRFPLRIRMPIQPNPTKPVTSNANSGPIGNPSPVLGSAPIGRRP